MVPRLLRVHPKTRDRLDRERRAAERDGAYRVAKRIHAVLLNTQGHTSGRIAGIRGLSPGVAPLEVSIDN